MNTNNGSLDFEIKLSIDQLQRSVDEAMRKFNRLADGASRSGQQIDNGFAGISHTLKGVAGSLGAVFAVDRLKSFAAQVIAVRGEMQALQTSFRTLAGADKGTALFEDIKKFAVATPMMMNDLARGAQIMLAFNIEAQNVMPILRAIGDISMGDAQRFNSLALSFSQMSATGKLMGQDLLQMINAGFNPLAVMSEKTGKSIGELKEKMEKGGISVQEVTDAFMAATAEGGKFHGMLEAQASGIKGSQAKLSGAVQDMMNSMGEAAEGTVVKVTNTLTSLTENYERVGRVLVGLVATYGTYKAAVMAVTAVEAAQASGMILKTQVLRRLVVAQQLLNATMLANPYVLAATALVGLIAVIASAKTHTERLRDAEKSYNEQKEEAIQKEREHRAEMNKLCDIANDDTTATDTRRKALMKLIEKYPDIFAQYKTEAEMLANILDIKQKIAAEDEKKSGTRAVNELDSVELRIAELEAKTAKKELRFGQLKTVGGRTADEEAELEMLRQKRTTLQKQAKQEAVDGYFANLTGISNDQLEAMIKRRSTLLSEIAMKEREGAKNVVGRITTEGPTVNGAYTAAQLQAQQAMLQSEQSRRNSVRSNVDRRAEAKKAYDAALKAYNDFLNSKEKMDEKAFDKELQRLQGNKDEAEKRLKALQPDGGGSRGSNASEEAKRANRLTVEAEERARANEDAARAEMKAARDAALQNRQDMLNLEKDSADKRLAQIALDGERMANAIADREEELLTKYREMRQRQWESANPNAKDEGRWFNPDTVTRADMEEAATLPGGEWIGAQLAAIAEARRVMAATTATAERNALEEMLAEVLTYQQQRQKIEEEYAARRNALYTTAPDGTRTLREGATQGNVAELDRRQTEALADVDEQFAQREASYQVWCDSIADMALEKLEATLATAKAELDKLAADPAADPQKLAMARAKVATAEKAVGKAREKNRVNPDSRALKDWQELYKTLNEVGEQFDKLGSQFTEMGGDFGETVGKIITECGSMTASTLQMVNGIVQLMNYSTSSIKATSATAAASIATVEKASVILAVISAALQIAIQIANLFNKDKEKEKKIAAYQERIEALEYSYRKVGEAASRAFSADASRLIEQQNRILEQQVAMIENQIALEKSKRKPDEERIKEYENRIRELRDEIAANKEKAVEAIFGDDVKSAINNFADALVEAWGRTADKARATKDFVRSMIKQMVIEAMKADLATPVKRMREMLATAWADGVISTSEEAELLAYASRFAQEAESKYAWADRFLKDPTASSGSGTSGGFAAASQDSVEELSGRAAAIHTSGEMRRTLLAGIQFDTAAIRAQIAANHETAQEMRSLQLLAVGHLETIARNTRELYEMNNRLAKIEQNTRNL